MTALTRAQLQSQLRAAQKRVEALTALLPADVWRRPYGTIPYADGDRYVGGFGIASDTTPGKTYKIAFDLAAGYWVCSCMAGTRRGRCKHLDRYSLTGRAAVQSGKTVETPKIAPAPLDAKPLPPMPKSLVVTARTRRFAQEDEI